MRRIFPCAAVLALCVCMTGGRLAHAQIPCGGYEVAHIIQAPPCPFVGPPVTVGGGISPNGRWVVGYYAQCATSNHEMFVYDTTTAQFSTIPRPAGTSGAIGGDVNDDGWICGTYQTAINPVNGLRGFVRNLNTGETFELLAQNGTQGWSAAIAINSSGMVCGYRSIDDGGSPTTPQTAFRWSPDTGFEDLGLINGSTTQANAVNDKGTVTGWMIVRGQEHPFLWERGSVIDLGTLAILRTIGRGLNNLNQVVGHGGISPPPLSVNHAFLWANGKMLDLGALPGDSNSSAHEIDDSGLVIGHSRYSGQIQIDRAFIWYQGAMHDLHDLVQLPPNLQALHSAGAIASNGRIVAFGETTDNDLVAVVLGTV